MPMRRVCPRLGGACCLKKNWLPERVLLSRTRGPQGLDQASAPSQTASTRGTPQGVSPPPGPRAPPLTHTPWGFSEHILQAHQEVVSGWGVV